MVGHVKIAALPSQSCHVLVATSLTPGRVRERPPLQLPGVMTFGYTVHANMLVYCWHVHRFSWKSIRLELEA